MSAARDYRAPRKTPGFSPEAIAKVAARACSLQGLPEEQYRLSCAADRESFERGTYNVLAALESLGWTLTPPEETSLVWMPKD